MSCCPVVKKLQEFGDYVSQELNAGVTLCKNAPAYWTEQVKTGSAYWADQVQKAPSYWKDQIVKAPNFWWGQIKAAPAYWTEQATALVQECLDRINGLAGAPTAVHGKKLENILTESKINSATLDKTKGQLEELKKAQEVAAQKFGEVNKDFSDLKGRFDVAQQHIKNLEAANQKLVEEKARLNKEYDSLNKTFDDRSKELEGANQKLTKELETKTNENKKLQSQVSDLQKKLLALAPAKK